jgi:hypothetical protein
LGALHPSANDETKKMLRECGLQVFFIAFYHTVAATRFGFAYLAFFARQTIFIREHWCNSWSKTSMPQHRPFKNLMNNIQAKKIPKGSNINSPAMKSVKRMKSGERNGAGFQI